MARENDLVLVYYEGNPLFFARIEDISPDIKPGWYHVKLLILQVPVQTATWLLRDVYTDGTEFAMGGKKMRIEPVEIPSDNTDALLEKGNTASLNAKIISISDLKTHKRRRK